MIYKKYLALLLLLPLLCKTGLAAASFDRDSSVSENNRSAAFSFHLVNDNYIAAWLPGEDGHYFGADDFLTGAFLLNYYNNNWQFSLAFHAVTLRHYNMRYDLLSLSGRRKFLFQNFQLAAAGGILFKGEYGGNYYQNGYHKFRAIKRVEFPYSSDKGAALSFEFQGSWGKQGLLLKEDNIRLTLASKIITDFVPASVTLAAAYRYSIWQDVLQAEILCGFKNYLNSIRQYSEMVNSGFIFGSNVKVNFWQEYFLDIGFVTLPTKNIESDPKYPPYKRDFLPQVWIGMSWQTRGLLIPDFMPY